MPHVTLATNQQGLILQAIIGLSSPRLDALKAGGQPTPAPVPVIALIDTGADSTMIDKSVIAKLGIPPIGMVPIHTASTGTQPLDCQIFDVCLGIHSRQAGSLITVVDTLAVLESDFSSQGGLYNALIGRDVLSRALLIYNGTESSFTLCF